MFRAVLLSALAISLMVLPGCWPLAQSRPSASTPAPASVATAAPRPTAKPTNGGATAKPTSKPAAAAAKPAAASSPTPASASAKPAGKTGSGTNGTGQAASQPAVMATSVSGLPAVVASRGAKPGSSDTLGVAASANAAAAANASDTEATALCGPGAILSTRAGQAAGRQATVAIATVDGSYQANAQGQPTFLHDAPYPNHVFTAVIWGSARRQFNPSPEGAWHGKALCVTGPVELYQQRPRIVVNSPSQLRAAR